MKHVSLLFLFASSLVHAADGSFTVTCKGDYPRSVNEQALIVKVNPLLGTLQFEALDGGESYLTGNVHPTHSTNGSHHLVVSNFDAGFSKRGLEISGAVEEFFRVTRGQVFELKLVKSDYGSEPGYSLVSVKASRYFGMLPGADYVAQPLHIRSGATCAVTAE
jgi:hypothetical protein